MAKSVSCGDLRVMMDLIHDGYADEPAQGLPAAAAAGLSRTWWAAIPSACSS